MTAAPRRGHRHASPQQARPVTLFTGQWADLPFEEVCRLAVGVGLRRPGDRLLG